VSLFFSSTAWRGTKQNKKKRVAYEASVGNPAKALRAAVALLAPQPVLSGLEVL
jgi:hypothetical protein